MTGKKIFILVVCAAISLFGCKKKQMTLTGIYIGSVHHIEIQTGSYVTPSYSTDTTTDFDTFLITHSTNHIFSMWTRMPSGCITYTTDAFFDTGSNLLFRYYDFSLGYHALQFFPSQGIMLYVYHYEYTSGYHGHYEASDTFKGRKIN